MVQEPRFGVESTILSARIPNIVNVDRVELDMHKTFASLSKEKLPITKVSNTGQFEKGSARSSPIVVNSTCSRCKLFKVGKCRDFGSFIMKLKSIIRDVKV